MELAGNGGVAGKGRGTVGVGDRTGRGEVGVGEGVAGPGREC